MIALNHPSVELRGVARDGHHELASAPGTMIVRSAAIINVGISRLVLSVRAGSFVDAAFYAHAAWGGCHRLLRAPCLDWVTSRYIRKRQKREAPQRRGSGSYVEALWKRRA